MKETCGLFITNTIFVLYKSGCLLKNSLTGYLGVDIFQNNTDRLAKSGYEPK